MKKRHPVSIPLEAHEHIVKEMAELAPNMPVSNLYVDAAMVYLNLLRHDKLREARLVGVKTLEGK